MSRAELLALAEQARAHVDAMPPAERKAHDEAQRASFIRGMTTPCEHGRLDFEQCADCRALAERMTDD